MTPVIRIDQVCFTNFRSFGTLHLDIQQTEGVAVEEDMAAVMGVASTPDIPIRHELNRYRAMIQDGVHDQEVGRTRRAVLEAHFGPRHPEMLDLDRLIRFQRIRVRADEGRLG